MDKIGIEIKADASASDGMMYEEGYPSLAASVIQKGVILPDKAAFGEPFKHGIGCGLITGMVGVILFKIRCGGRDIQLFFPFISAFYTVR